MSFRDELNSIRPDMKMISEQEVYEKILYREYEKIKEKIKEDAKIQVYKNILVGKTRLSRWNIHIEDKEYNRIQVKTARMYKIENDCHGGGWLELNGEVTKQIINKHLLSKYANVSVSLTEIGRQYVRDLKEIAKADDITFSFYPYLSGTENMEVELSEFDIFEKINLDDAIYRLEGRSDLKRIHSGVNVHYEIEL